MPCGCGRSYIVNENDGYSNRRKTDTSFRSFITFLLVVLLVCIAIYCVILTVDQRKGKNLQHANASKDNLHGKIEQPNTENSSISIKDTTNNYDTSLTPSDNKETTASLIYNEASEDTKNQYVTSTFTQMETTTKLIHINDLLFPDSETLETNILEMKTQDYNDITQKPRFNTVTEFSPKQNYDVFTTSNDIITSQTTNMQYLVTDLETNTHLIDDNTSENIFSEELEIKEIFITNIGSISESSELHNFFTALTKMVADSDTESKEDFTNSQKIATKEPNESFSKHVYSDTEKFNNEATTTETLKQVTNGELQKKSFQMDPRHNEINMNDNSTSSNDIETVVKILEEKQTIEPTPLVEEKLIKNDLNATQKKNVCTETTCKEKVGQILQLMDHSIDPCDDFYQFSCGGVNNVIEKYTDVLLKHVFTFSNTTDKYLESFRKFFNSCIKYETDVGYSKKIKQVLSSNVRDSNLTSLLSFLMLRQSTPLFEVRYGFVGGKEGYGMQILPSNSIDGPTRLKDWSLQSQIEKECLNFDPKLKYESELDLPTVYEGYTKCKEVTFRKMAENFVMEKQMDRTKVPNKIALNNFLSFFLKINKVSGPTLRNAVLNQNYTKTNIEQLSQKYSAIDWHEFFKIITERSFGTTSPIFLYLEQEYFTQIMSDLKERLLKTKKEVIETLKLYYQLELYQILLAPKPNKEEFCINQAVELMPEIATKIIYDTSKLEIFHLSEFEGTFYELKKKFYGIIEGLQLEEANKNTYKDILELLTIKLFEDNEEWKKYLEKSYDNFYLMDDYLSNMFMFIENKRRSTNVLRSDDENFIFSQLVNSQFQSTPKMIPDTNVIAIPNRFLYKMLTTPPHMVKFYSKFYLSRAIALHFNDVDEKLKSPFYRRFLNSLNSNVENGDDIKILKNQRISYKNKLFWQETVRFSEAARMADNIALDMAFQDIFITNETLDSLPWIYEEYSPQQQFFISIAQEYCENPTVPALAQHLYESSNIPSAFLVENMILNSETFSKTFECPLGTPMNPEEKLQIDNFSYSENNYKEYDTINK